MSENSKAILLVFFFFFFFFFFFVGAYFVERGESHLKKKIVAFGGGKFEGLAFGVCYVFFESKIYLQTSLNNGIKKWFFFFSGEKIIH